MRTHTLRLNFNLNTVNHNGRMYTSKNFAIVMNRALDEGGPIPIYGSLFQNPMLPDEKNLLGYIRRFWISPTDSVMLYCEANPGREELFDALIELPQINLTFGGKGEPNAGGIPGLVILSTIEHFYLVVDPEK